jgi:hypothetical protein
VGDFKTKDHGVNGTVYISGENTLLLKRFNYDGKITATSQGRPQKFLLRGGDDSDVLP